MYPPPEPLTRSGSSPVRGTKLTDRGGWISASLSASFRASATARSEMMSWPSRPETQKAILSCALTDAWYSSRPRGSAPRSAATSWRWRFRARRIPPGRGRRRSPPSPDSARAPGSCSRLRARRGCRSTLPFTRLSISARSLAAGLWSSAVRLRTGPVVPRRSASSARAPAISACQVRASAPRRSRSSRAACSCSSIGASSAAGSVVFVCGCHLGYLLWLWLKLAPGGRQHSARDARRRLCAISPLAGLARPRRVRSGEVIDGSRCVPREPWSSCPGDGRAGGRCGPR